MGAFVSLIGDSMTASAYIGAAKSQHVILLEEMRLRGLSSYMRTTMLSPTVKVVCSSCFGIDKIEIYAQPRPLPPRKRIERVRIKEKDYWYAFVTCYEGGLPIPSGQAMAVCLDIDGAGNVYTAGAATSRQDTVSGTLSIDPTFTKHDNNGTFLMRRSVVGTDLFDAGTGISAVGGEVFLLGDTYTDRMAGNYDAILAKYDGATGDFLWQRRLEYGSTEDVTVFGRDVVARGEVAVFTGRTYSYVYERYESYLVSVNRESGSEVFNVRLGDYVPTNASGSCTGEAIEIDLDGNVIVVGHHYFIYDTSEGCLFPDGLIAKFNSSGGLVWKRSIRGMFRQDNGLYGWYGDGTKITDCAIDRAGNVYLCSSTTIVIDGSGGRVHTRIYKLSADGALLWYRAIDLPYYGVGTNLAFAAEVAYGAGGVYLMFRRYPDGVVNTQTAAVVMRLQPETGAVLWQRAIYAPTGPHIFTGADGLFPRSICADSFGDIYLAFDLEFQAAMVVAKLPGDGSFVGEFQNIIAEITDIPVYDNMEDIPVYQSSSGGTEDPGYEFAVRSDFTMPLGTGTGTLSTITPAGYTPETWEQTEHILRQQMPD